MLHNIDTRSLVAAFAGTSPDEWTQVRSDPAYHVFRQVRREREAMVHWHNKYPKVELRDASGAIIRVVSKRRAMDLASQHVCRSGNEAVTAVFATLGKALGISPDKMAHVLLEAMRESVTHEPEVRSSELDHAVQSLRTLFEKPACLRYNRP